MSKEDSFMGSERAVQVLQILARSENGSYATEISKKYGLDRSTVARILHKLEQRELVKEGKTGKAQYYEVNISGIVDFVLDEISINYDSLETSEVTKEDIEVYLTAYYRMRIGLYEGERFADEIAMKNARDDLYNVLFVKPALEIPKLDVQNKESQALKDAFDVYIGVGTIEGLEFSEVLKETNQEMMKED